LKGQIILGWFLIIFPGILIVGQIISSVNFSLAQKLGLQEDPDETDSLLQRAEHRIFFATYIVMALLGIVVVTYSLGSLCTAF